MSTSHTGQNGLFTASHVLVFNCVILTGWRNRMLPGYTGHKPLFTQPPETVKNRATNTLRRPRLPKVSRKGLCDMCGRITEFLFGSLAGVLFLGGCQLSGASATSNSNNLVPEFGLNVVPRQSEPPLENSAEVETAVARQSSASSMTDDDGENAPSEKTGNLLSRWFSGRDKGAAPRKVLPVSDRTATAAEDFD